MSVGPDAATLNDVHTRREFLDWIKALYFATYDGTEMESPCNTCVIARSDEQLFMYPPNYQALLDTYIPYPGAANDRYAKGVLCFPRRAAPLGKGGGAFSFPCAVPPGGFYFLQQRLKYPCVGRARYDYITLSDDIFSGMWGQCTCEGASYRSSVAEPPEGVFFALELYSGCPLARWMCRRLGKGLSHPLP